PWVLPHNSGETYDLAGKLTVPIGSGETLRFFGLRSWEQRLLYDQTFKYDDRFAPANRVAGTLASAHWQHVAGPATERPLQLDADWGLGPDADLYFGGAVVRQRVQTFARALGFLPVGDTVPPAVASDFSPLSAAAYAESQLRWSDLGLTLGVRYDQFDPRAR